MAAVLRTQATGAANGVADVTATVNGVQSGDLLVACFYERDGAAVTGVSDSVNGAWTQAVTRGAVAARIAIYYFENSAAGNPLVTATLAGTSPRDINVSVWSGCATSSALNTTGNAGNSGVTAHTHGSMTPSQAALLITTLGSTDHGGVASLDTSFLALDIDVGVTNTNRRVYAYKLTHTGALNPTHNVNSSSNSDAVVAAFLEAAAGAAPRRNPSRLTLMGVA